MESAGFCVDQNLVGWFAWRLESNGKPNASLVNLNDYLNSSVFPILKLA